MVIMKKLYTIFHRNKVASEPPTVIAYISSNKNLMATIAVDAVFSSINSALGVVQGYWNIRRFPCASPEMTFVRWLPICTAVVVVGSFLYPRLFQVPATLKPRVHVWSSQVWSLRYSGFRSSRCNLTSAWTRLKSAVTAAMLCESSLQSRVISAMLLRANFPSLL